MIIVEKAKLFQNIGHNKNTRETRKILVCVTEHYVPIFSTRLWSVRKPMLFDTQNAGILGFSTAHAYKYKTKRQAKNKRDSRKTTFLLISHQATLVQYKPFIESFKHLNVL